MDTETLLFTVSNADMIVGLRVDRVSSFRYDVQKKTLTVRYVNDETSDSFEGPVAEALMRELRYGGRK
jgi:hypothetical protein